MYFQIFNKLFSYIVFFSPRKYQSYSREFYLYPYFFIVETLLSNIIFQNSLYQSKLHNSYVTLTMLQFQNNLHFKKHVFFNGLKFFNYFPSSLKIQPNHSQFRKHQQKHLSCYSLRKFYNKELS